MKTKDQETKQPESAEQEENITNLGVAEYKEWTGAKGCLWGCTPTMLLIASVIFFVLFLGYRYVTVGFCFKEGRYLTDKEYILPELETLIKSGQLKLYPADTSAESYLVNHPGCCSVERNYNRSFIDTVFNFKPIIINWMIEENREQCPPCSYCDWSEVSYSSCGTFQGSGDFQWSEDGKCPEYKSNK